jgi:hypothetical protein
MKLQQTNSDKFDEQIKYYKGKSLAQLQLIIPKWAYGNNSDNILDITLRPNEKEYLIFLVIQASERCKKDMRKEILKMTGWVPAENNGKTVCSRYIWQTNCLKWQ